jgi:N-acetylglucosaminyldiphosphoundecaprenol N-acetyl-beta-D-mannosaminyltransferase
VTAPQIPRFRLGQLDIDRVTFAGALEAITALVEARRGGTVFTPNVDHVVMAGKHEGFRRAYAAADLSLADGMPVVWASRALGTPLPAKISGSDLVDPLMALAEAKGFRVYLLGGGDGVAEQAARNLRRKHPQLAIAGTASPRIDMRQPASQRQSIVDEIQKTAPDLILVALGAPKQELWIHEVAEALRPAVLLGVGASIDFLAGTARRAPRWISAAGLEWLYRLVHEPRRLWRRYLVQDPAFLGILLGDLRARRALGLGRGEIAP